MRRSFSCDTVLAADRAEKNSSSVSWTNATIWNSSRPNRAVSPRVASLVNPTVACQAVMPMTHEQAEGGDAGGVSAGPAGGRSGTRG